MLSVLLVPLLIFRLFAAVVVDPIFLFNWPLHLENCQQACTGKVLSALCTLNCQARQNIYMDLTEYLKADVVTANPGLDTQIIGGQAIILSVLLVFVVVGSLFKSNASKKLGLLCVGLYINMLVPLFVKTFQLSPDPWQVVLFNAGDIAFLLLLLIHCWSLNIQLQKVKKN
jgi:hypothetical protein